MIDHIQRFGLVLLLLMGLVACDFGQTSADPQTEPNRQNANLNPAMSYLQQPLADINQSNDMFCGMNVNPTPIPYEPRRIRVSIQHQGTNVRIKRGDILEVRLASSPSIGFKWVPSPKLRLLHQLPSLEFEASSTLTETEGFETLVFEAIDVGSSGFSLTDQRIMDATNEPYYLYGFFLHVTEP